MSKPLIDMGEVDALRIYSLLDDYSGYESPFLGHHGISLLLDVVAGDENRRILLDAGQSADPILYNAKLHNIDMSSIDMIFISHCHYDHTGGLVGVLKEIGREIPVVAHPTIFRENYIFEPHLRNIGITRENGREAITENGGQLVLLDEPFHLMEGVISTGEVNRATDFERQGIGTYNIEDGRIVPDRLMDDMSIVVNIKGKGLFIVSGCSHAGIVNIVRHAVKITGVEKVYGLAGGLHLIKADDERIDKTVEALKEMNLKLVAAGHCTGLKALSRLSTVFEEKFELLHSGKVISISG